MATLITGGTGFVGSNIARALAEGGHRVVSMDIAPPDEMVRKYLKPWDKQVTWIQGDILNPKVLEEIATSHELEKIVHAAAYTGNREGIEKSDSRRMLDINIGGTINMLDLARRLEVQRFLYVSSGGVYAVQPSSEEPLREDMRLYPSRFYDIGKYACEMLARRYGDLHGFDTVSVRPSSQYGPMERASDYRATMSLVYSWTRSAVRGEPIDLSRTSADRDFIYVLDTARAIRAILDAPSREHDVYNVAKGHRVTREEMMEAMKKAHPGVTFMESNLSPGPTTDRGPVDISRLKELGYTPEYDIESGLREYIAWRKELPFTD